MDLRAATGPDFSQDSFAFELQAALVNTRITGEVDGRRLKLELETAGKRSSQALTLDATPALPGALYPRFTVENPAKVSTGFGGMVFMMVSILYIGAVGALSAQPAYVYLRAQVEGTALPAGFWAQTALFILAIGLIQGAGTLLPMHAGARRLESREVSPVENL